MTSALLGFTVLFGEEAVDWEYFENPPEFWELKLFIAKN